MQRGRKMMLCGLAGLALGAMTRSLADTDPSGPYHGIVERNVFNLKPPAPAVPPEPPPLPPPKIKLNGIFTILGPKRVGLTVSVPPKPPDPAKEESYILNEGDRKGDVEVLQIDVAGGIVKLKNHGTYQTLNFTNDGAKLVSMAPALPPVPQNPNTYQAPGMANPGAPGSAAGRTIPPRAVRLPQPPTPNGANNSGARPPDAFGSAAQPNSGQANPQSAASQVSPEMRTIMIEVERERTKNDPTIPPPPYTSLTPNEAIHDSTQQRPQ